MAAELELPKQIFIHGYLTMGGDKMSKSLGNVFDPFPVIEAHGPDPVRFYVLREVQFGADGAVSQEGFERRYDTELANDLGNLVSRSASMLVKYRGNDDGVASVPEVPSGVAFATDATVMGERWKQQMTELDLSGALETIWSFVRDLNRHVEERAPWKLAKDPTNAQLLETTLGELAEGLIAVAYALSPVMPSTSDRIAAAFGVTPEELRDWRWGIAHGRDVTKPSPLFPRLEQVTPA
jgi:methionyl-tRNA synthetase